MEEETLPEIYNVDVLGKYLLIKRNVVLVDRGSNWGNPFVMDSEKDRDYVCNMFNEYSKWRLTIEPNWLVPLKGKNLACHCYPKRCHAETLRKLANM